MNLVSWSAFLGTLVGVWQLARGMGAGKAGALLAVLYSATLPMAIVQASSTMNDLVLSFWAVVVAVESLDLWKGKSDRPLLASLTGAAGLALVTKPTALAFLLPFAAADFVCLWRRKGPAAAALLGLGAFAVVAALNAGYLGRNLATYGGLVDPLDVQRHRNANLDPRAVASNLVRNAALHLGTPSPYVNKAIAVGIRWLHAVLGVDPNDPRTTAAGEFRIRRPGLHEDWVANPLHFLAVLGALGLLVARREHFSTAVWLHAAAVAGGVLAFSALYKWLPFNSRLHTPAFILAAPLVGLALDSPDRRRWAISTGTVLAMASLPWLLSLDSRP